LYLPLLSPFCVFYILAHLGSFCALFIYKTHPNNRLNKNNENDKGANSNEVCPIPLFNVGTKNDIEPKSQRDLDVTEAMKTYMSDLYKQKTKKQHPALKKAQYDKVYESIKDFADENNLQCQDIIVKWFSGCGGEWRHDF
jgi:predicted choloylglycine hydrolase